MDAFVTQASVFGPGGLGLDAWRHGAIDDGTLTSALTMRGLRHLSRTARIAMVAAAAALPPATPTSVRDAVVLGSAWSSVGPLADFVQVAVARGEDRVFPMAFPNTVVSVHVGHVATLLGCTGPALTVCGEHAGVAALVEGLALLDSGRADRVLAIGADAAEPAVVAVRGTKVGEGAVALRLASGPEEEGCLAVITGWWTAPDRNSMDPGASTDEPDPVPDPVAGAADGAVAIARAARRVHDEGTAVTLTAPCGVSGVAAIRLEPL